MSTDSIGGLLRSIQIIERPMLDGGGSTKDPRFAEHLVEHGRKSLQYIHVFPLKFTYQTMFKHLRHFEIQLRPCRYMADNASLHGIQPSMSIPST